MIDHTRGNQASVNWLLYDGHGNLVRLMAPDYRLSTFQWRGVWGEGQGSLGTGRGYCANLGHPEDETGLVYMRARYYEPATGRFISEDPARDGMNWYLYADGNPVNKVDESGKAANPVVIAIAHLFIAMGMFFMLAAVTFPFTPGAIQQAYAELMAAYAFVKQVWQDFTFGVMLNIAAARLLGRSILLSLPKIIVDAFVAVFQVTVSTAPLAAIAPGGWRAALAIVGATSAAIGIVLWASEVFGGND